MIAGSVDNVRELLGGGVKEVFKTMLTLDAVPAARDDIPAAGQMMVTGSVGIVGEVNGVVCLFLTASFARKVAGRMLGMTDEEMDGDDLVNDVIGELANMISGVVKSRLSDSGLPCTLTIPSIVRGNNFGIEPSGTSARYFLNFRCGADHILVELLMKNAA